jgi:hypothetical protein
MKGKLTMIQTNISEKDPVIAKKVMYGLFHARLVERPNKEKGIIDLVKIDELITKDAVRWAYHPVKIFMIDGKISPIVTLQREEGELDADLCARMRKQFFDEVEKFRERYDAI